MIVLSTRLDRQIFGQCRLRHLPIEVSLRGLQCSQGLPSLRTISGGFVASERPQIVTASCGAVRLFTISDGLQASFFLKYIGPLPS